MVVPRSSLRDVHRRTDGGGSRAHVDHALMAHDAGGGRIEAVPVVLDLQSEVTCAVDREPDDGARRSGVATDVAERLVGHAQEVGGHGLLRFVHGLVGIELDVDDRVATELVDGHDEPGQERHAAQELGAKAEDEVADVADREVQAGDGPLDPPLDLVRVLPDQVRNVLQRQPDGVEVLDDAVVEVLADAVTLVHDGQSLDLLVQPRVLDGDAGMDRERLEQVAGPGR